MSNAIQTKALTEMAKTICINLSRHDSEQAEVRKGTKTAPVALKRPDTVGEVGWPGVDGYSAAGALRRRREER
jgi:hypothetical protein